MLESFRVAKFRFTVYAREQIRFPDYKGAVFRGGFGYAFKVGLNTDLEGWRPEAGKKDKDGNEVDGRIYNTRDFDKNLVIDERTNLVAKNDKYVMRITGDDEQGKREVDNFINAGSVS